MRSLILVITMETPKAATTLMVREWDANTFHRKVLTLEEQGYTARRETYRITAEMNPETGEVLHLHTIELWKREPSGT